MRTTNGVVLPDISGRENLDELVRKFAVYFVEVIEEPHTFEELKKAVYVRCLKPLVSYLVDEVHHEAVVSALLALKWHFSGLEDEDDRGLNDTRALACEVTAWRFVTHLTYEDAIDHLCYEVELAKANAASVANDEERNANGTLRETVPDEQTSLLDGAVEGDLDDDLSEDTASDIDGGATTFATTFANLNALEIAAVSGSKKFLSQKAIQRIIDAIWKGDIVFWDTLSKYSTKRARIYNRDRSDPYCRLRVPLYLRLFEVLFFAAFLVLYYIVLAQDDIKRVTAAEIMLYIWFAAFSYNELGEYFDAGSFFYATDFWSLWDVMIIATGVAFFIARVVGMAGGNHRATKIAFDILSVEALFLVPRQALLPSPPDHGSTNTALRTCSLLSLHPYFGMLLPALKEMTKDFVKFLGLVAILYMGFDTTFTFLARGKYSFGKMNWILVKVFFGSGYLGFDIAEEISPILGPPLMFVFVCMTNVLLITSLISLLSNSLSKVMEHSRDEYLFVYSVFALEASTSNRLTYFLPPLNLIPLLLRPLRCVLPSERLRAVRIVLLKATHWPFVALILCYERWRLRLKHRRTGSSGTVRDSRSPNNFRRPLSASGRWLPKPLQATGTGQSPLVDEAVDLRYSRRTARASVGTAVVDTDNDLEAAVANIRTQLEVIASMVDAKRK